MRAVPLFHLIALAYLLPTLAATPDHAGGILTFDGPLSLTDMDGGRHDLDAQLEGGATVVLVFWQSWCASCLREGPGLAQAARVLEGRVLFYGIISGPDEAVDEAAVRAKTAAMHLPYPQIRDRTLALTEACHVTGTPTIVVLGRDRRILYHGHRPPADWTAWPGANPP